jgi:hypothetical protein
VERRRQEEEQRQQEQEQQRQAAAAALQLQQQQQALLHQQTEQLNASLGRESGMSNEQLAYELILDPFCVLRYSDEQQSCTSLITTNIRQTFPKAFWDKLKQELLTTPPPSSSSNDNSSTSYASVFTVLTEILDSVINVCRGWDNNSVHNIAQRIQDILDIDHLKQRVAAGAMPPSDIFSMMSSLISGIKELQMLVTPPSVPSNVFIFRGLYHHHQPQNNQQSLLLQHDHDRSTIQRAKQLQLEAQWTQITSSQEHFLYNALYHAMERIYILRTDMANKKLRSIMPVLTQHGIQYLYNHTAKKLQSGEITLQKTEAWVASSLRSIFFLSPSSAPSSSSSQHIQDASSQHIQDLQQGLRDGRPQAYSFFVDASITLLVATSSFAASTTLELPELLRLDRLRFKALSAHFHTDVMSKVILDTIRSQNLSASTLASVTDTIKTHPPYPSKPNNTVQLILRDCIPQEHVPAISQLLKDHLTPSHPFYQQAKDSMHEKWLQVVVATITPATDTSSHSVVDPPFLPNRHAMDLQNIIRLSKKVYAGTYSRIIRNQMDLLNS